TAAVENDAENVDARVRLAQYMVVSGNLERAFEYADRAYELSPGDPDVLAVRASVAYQMEEKDFALRLAQEAIQIEPLHPAANVVVITERVEAGEIEEALAMTDAILSTSQDDLSLHLLKLRLFDLANRPEATHEQLELVVEKFPDIVSLRRVLGQSYIRLGELDAAEEQLRAIATLEPEETSHKITVVRFLGATQGIDAAIAELHRLIETEERKWPFQRTLAQVYEENGRADEARALVERIIADGGREAIFAKVRLARYELEAGRRDEAAAIIDGVLAEDEGNVDALAIRGALEIEREQYAEAIETLRLGLAAEPEDVRLLLLSGRAHQLSGNDALAADLLSNATRVSDYRPVVTQEYVRYLLQRGRIDAAEAVLSETARRAPQNRDVLTALAELRLRQEDFVGAESIAKQLREIDGGADLAERVMAASLSGQDRHEESLAILRGLSQDSETRQETMTQLIQSMIATENGEEAEAFLARILEEDPANLRARMLQASLAESRGDTKQAIMLFEQILQDFPRNAEIYFIMYRIRMEQGRQDDADA
ncbi:MAG: tetratricopeptide repeat protein, partial [Pseudomonadota bacterium]